MLLIHQFVKPHAISLEGCQRQFNKGSYKNIYSDISSICTGIFSLLVNIEQRRWQTWCHTHVDVCQRHLSRLVTASDDWSESFILSCLQAFLILTYLFDVLSFFMIQLLSLLVHCNVCRVDINFGKRVFFSTCMYQCLDISGRWSSKDWPPLKSGQHPSKCFFSGSGNWAIHSLLEIFPLLNRN